MIMYFRMTLELYGRTIRVNLAKPMKMKEGATRAGKNDINDIDQFAQLFKARLIFF